MVIEGDEDPWWQASLSGALKVDFSPRGDDMPASLRGAWAKWERAVEHHRGLAQAGRDWLDEPAFDIAVEYDANIRAHVACFVVHRSAPARLGAIAGDCLHNLRSALDLLAWELAHKKLPSAGAAPPAKLDHVAFPIARPDDTEASFAKRQALKFFEDEARARVVEYQRFGVTNRDHEPLLLLGALSNIDKHRLILVGAAAVRLRETRFAWQPDDLRASGEFLLKDGDSYDHRTRFGLIRFAGGGHPEAIVTVAEKPGADLRLTYDGTSKLGLLMLAGCIWRVREILESFEPLLPDV